MIIINNTLFSDFGRKITAVEIKQKIAHSNGDPIIM